jgi:uncharacterized protein
MDDTITTTMRAWMELAVDLLGQQRDEIDRLNVFPVPDGDTGTNLYLTMEAAAAALQSAATTDAAECAQVMAQGALLGARGNSGVITSQILRGFADAVIDAQGQTPSEIVANGLSLAAAEAYRAVAVPREGTILSVIKAAASAADPHRESPLLDVVREAMLAAEEALARTPEQLPALREAGVVDAGGRGLVVLLDALRRAITGENPPMSRIPQLVPPPVHQPLAGYDGPEYEVMYLLAADDERVPEFRQVLNTLGDSVVVVGGRGLWNVHVHTDDVGAAIERAVEIGRPYRIRVTRLLAADSLRTQGRGVRGERGIVVVGHGDSMVEFLRESGAVPVRAPDRGRPSTAELLAAIESAQADEVIVLPSDRDTAPVAEAAAAAARDSGVRVSVVPSRSVVQSLAALAVHDPQARLDDDLVAMGRAAGATRYAGVTVAARRGTTTAGICEVGDIIGLVDGDIVEIGESVAQVCHRVVERLLASGAELLTVVTGDSADPAITEAVERHALQVRPYAEVDVIDGGQAHWPYIFGAE